MATTAGTASQFMGDEGQQALQLPRQDADVLQALGPAQADVSDEGLNGQGLDGPLPKIAWPST